MDDFKKEIGLRLIDTLSSANQERVRLKKRRLEAHFQKMEHITGAAFTIASEEVGETVVGGYFLRLNALPPTKPLQMASEGYCSDSVHAHLLSPLFQALSTLYSLDLADLPVSFHFVSLKAMERCSRLLNSGDPKDLIEEGVYLLCKQLPKVEILACTKGPFFEKMQSKIYLLKRHNLSELVFLDFEVIAKALLEPSSLK